LQPSVVGHGVVGVAQGLEEPGVDRGAGVAQRPPVGPVQRLWIPKSLGLLIVVSTRNARCSLK
jgi:hypothetical protein